MIALYKSYVIGTENYIKIDPKGLEEKSRAINHLEKSIYNICESNTKRIERKKKDIQKKGTENATLIQDLNDIY
jgi:hypothetical protein